MLAQNFKSAVELGISEAHLAALQKTLVLAETGKLIHTDPHEHRFDLRPKSFTGHFNMGFWALSKECGTCCCLGGTAEIVGGLQECELDEARRKNPELENLFYPGMYRRCGMDMKSITTSQAATALRSYLTIGDARWDLAAA